MFIYFITLQGSLLVLGIVLDGVVVASAAWEVDSVLHQILLIHGRRIYHDQGRIVHGALQRPPHLNTIHALGGEHIAWQKRVLDRSSFAPKVKETLEQREMHGCKTSRLFISPIIKTLYSSPTLQTWQFDNMKAHRIVASMVPRIHP